MVYISYILVWSNIPHYMPTERQLANILFQTRCLYLIVFDFWPGHSRVGCSRLLTVCSRLLTVCSRLLMVCSRFAHGFRGSFESFTFFLSPYEVPFGSLRGSAHGCSRLLTVCSRLLTVCSRLLTVCSWLLTVCSRFGKGAQNLCAKFQADVFWEIFEPCHGANPSSATIPHMKDSFWAQRTQKVHLESSI